MADAADRTTPQAPANRPAPAQKPASAPAPAAKADKDRESAEIGALRARVAQLEEERSQERRTSDPRSPDYSAELALEEAWPASVRERA